MPFQTCMTSTVEHKQRYADKSSLLSSIQRNSIETGLARSKIDKNCHKSTKSKSIIKVVNTIHELYYNSSEVIQQLLTWAVFYGFEHMQPQMRFTSIQQVKNVDDWLIQSCLRCTAMFQTSGSAHKNISKRLHRFNSLRPQCSSIWQCCGI